MNTFPKYKQNLKVIDVAGTEYVQSYTTAVARIDHEAKEVIELGYWSMTTTKHVNYVAAQYGYRIIRHTNI